jgi:hypothetical protein
MNSKKILLLLVIASMMLSLLPSAMFASAATLTSPILYTKAGVAIGTTKQVKGTVIVVKSAVTGEIPAGTGIGLYWDSTTISPFNGVKGLLNSTLAKSSGGYEVWFTIPQATNGTHYVWIKTDAGDTARATIYIKPKISLSSTTGQVGDSITGSYYGFSGTTDLRIAYVLSGTFPNWPTIVVANETIAYGDGATTEFTETLAHKGVKPGSAPVRAGTVTLADNAAGDIGATGSINYVTGAVDAIFATAPTSGRAVWVAYQYFDTSATTVKYLATVSTNSVGTAIAAETVPSGGDGSFAAFDGNGVYGEKPFAIGPTITVTPDVSASGATVHILGRGWKTGTPSVGDTIGTTTNSSVLLEEPGMPNRNCWIYNPTSGIVHADSNGNFAMDVVVPQGKSINDDYTIWVTATNGHAASADFEITALAVVSVSPEFGAQGSSMTVSGKNYPKVSNTPIAVYLIDATTSEKLAKIGTAKTLADGTFSKSFSVPAYTSGNYKISAYNSTISGYTISDDVSFTVGSLVILLSDSSLPVGGTFTLTGSGFTALGYYNATLGTKTLVSSDTVGIGGVISKTGVMVPYGLAAGTYTLTVFDVSTEIKVTTQFKVEYGTSITLSPSSFPSGFNVSITGQGWPYVSTTDNPTFTLYNKTSTGSVYSLWSMDVYNASRIVPVPVPFHVQTLPATVNATGFFFGWWIAKPSGVKLSNGVYYVNVTDAYNTNFKAQASFTVISKVVSCAPRKTTFLIGETISFNIQHSFGNVAPIVNSKITIKDPAGNVVFRGDPLATWVKSGDYYVVPYSSQTAGLNPMILADDAPLGTWTWKWPDTAGDTIASGSFTVAASTASQTDAKIDALSKQITDMKTASDAAKTAADAAKTAAASAQTTAQSAVTAATDAKTAATDAKTAVTALGAKADAATVAANAATAAANAAKAAADSLTTMVYVAIAASVVAALAAIFAVMQITKKIA